MVASVNGYWFYPVLGLMIFSFVFIFPLLLFFVFPQKLHLLKKNFGIKKIQFTLGLLSLVVAVQFLNNASSVFGWSFLNRNFVLLFWMLSLFVWLVFLFFPFWQKDRLQNITKFTVGKILASLFCLFSIFYLVQGLGDKSLGGTIDVLLPAAKNGYLKHEDFVSREELESLQWLSSIEQALAMAQTEDKNIFVDFSGKSCLNCRWMEQNIFPTKEVFTKLKEQFYDSKKTIQRRYLRCLKIALLPLKTKALV